MTHEGNVQRCIKLWQEIRTLVTLPERVADSSLSLLQYLFYGLNQNNLNMRLQNGGTSDDVST